MFAIAVAVGFHEDAQCQRQLAAMVAGFTVEPLDGTEAAATKHAAAAVMRWAVVKRDRQAAPLWNPDRRILFCGDVRLYNRDQLITQLGGRLDLVGRSDLEVAYHAYLAWGADTPSRLIGDFTFVAWHESDRRLFAARDQLGVRPLYHRALADGWLFATDVRQILPLVPAPYDELDDERILHRLIPGVRPIDQTYFRGISLLKPGHSLSASENGHQESRYWLPKAVTGPSRMSYEDNCEYLLQLFRQSVRDRLDSDYPIVAHSSGGFDSSTILASADEIYRREPTRPPLVMASAMALGHPSDDSRYMDAITAQVQFEGVRWSALEPDPCQLIAPTPAYPGFARGLAGGPPGDIRLAKERDARVLLGGLCGDEVLFAGGILRDLFRHARWAELLRETFGSGHSIGRGSRMLARAALGVFPPPVAHLLDRRITDPPQPPPPWLGPRLRELHATRPSIRQVPTPSYSSHVAHDLWVRVSGPRSAAVLGGVVLYALEHGIEARMPFADSRIIEHLLSIPWQQRVPKGHLRRTGRDALGTLLPPAFASRTGQKPWTSVWINSARNASSLIARTIEEGPWLSAPYVQRGAARWMLRRALSDAADSDPTAWLRILDFAALEGWLRGLICYNPPARWRECPIVSIQA